MDVGGWLKSLGLERYEAAFQANDVNAAVLRTLTADDLRDIGVISVGHRRQILDAIAALRPQGVQDEAPDQVSSAPEPPGSTFRLDVFKCAAERRPLSVMFCDLVGSTTLSARLDPEDLRDLPQAYRTICGNDRPL